VIRASRRTVLAGALAVPTLSGLAAWRWRHGEQRVLLHDAQLDAGRRFADAAKAHGLRPVVIEGDRVRFMRQVLADRPAVVAGVSRHAEMQLLADIAQEEGYVLAAELEAKGRQCSGASCRPGWNALGRLGRSAGADWPEALAYWAADPRGALPQLSSASAGRPDRGLVLGWVLAKA
jgi:hypothetical protein